MAAARKSRRDRFAEHLGAVDGAVTFAKTQADAMSAALQIVKEAGASTVAVDKGEYLAKLGVADALKQAELNVVPGTADKYELATCDAGITSADYLIADTGTLALVSGAGLSRSVSLLPPLHIAIVPTRLLVESLEDLLAKLAGNGSMPSCLTLVTGPSRTADIEQVLTIGVHGPGALHVILVG